jgi:hypothetical protein
VNLEPTPDQILWTVQSYNTDEIICKARPYLEAASAWTRAFKQDSSVRLVKVIDLTLPRYREEVPRDAQPKHRAAHLPKGLPPETRGGSIRAEDLI